MDGGGDGTPTGVGNGSDTAGGAPCATNVTDGCGSSGSGTVGGGAVAAIVVVLLLLTAAALTAVVVAAYLLHRRRLEPGHPKALKCGMCVVDKLHWKYTPSTKKLSIL